MDVNKELKFLGKFTKKIEPKTLSMYLKKKKKKKVK